MMFIVNKGPLFIGRSSRQYSPYLWAVSSDERPDDEHTTYFISRLKIWFKLL